MRVARLRWRRWGRAEQECCCRRLGIRGAERSRSQRTGVDALDAPVCHAVGDTDALKALRSALVEQGGGEEGVLAALTSPIFSGVRLNERRCLHRQRRRRHVASQRGLYYKDASPAHLEW